MSKRLGSKVVTVERPRQKGWWGSPEPDEVEASQGDDGSTREVAKRNTTRPVRQAVQVGRALTPNQVDAIRAVMRLFVDEDLGRGLDPRTTLRCDRCDGPRPAAGSVRYERLTFCNSCSVDFEVARARGLLSEAAEFIDRAGENARSA